MLRQQQYRHIAINMVNEVRHSLPRIGTRKLCYMLSGTLPVGRDKLFSILREEQMLVGKRRRYTKTTNSKHWMRKYPNTVKDIQIVRPEQVWVSDITYIDVAKGFNYLHLVTDAYSKQIMGYHLSATMNAADTTKALRMAISNRQYPHEDLIHHSDRGLQYCSALYTETLHKHNIGISMTEQSDPYENAIAERINGILKDEFGLDSHFDNRDQLHKQTAQAVLLYNNIRPHLSNRMLTPRQMHQQQQIKMKTYKKKAPVILQLPVLS